MKKDNLIINVKKFLSHENTHLNSLDDVAVEAVAYYYMAELMESACIPYPHQELVQEHLMEDAWDIIRKVTYGALSLQDYRLFEQKDINHHQNKRKFN